ncbi:MAG: [FeFe] hydrogenase H-cluster radical SAM maturase HydE [Candidatus Cloacimonetes bacterium]|nr:[FeFe] hydrogenase H-cluster radical SAM maturase HydE [Candidatus Cloacimonadota bacterium]
MNHLLEILRNNRDLPDDDFKIIIEEEQYEEELFSIADSVRRQHYGVDVYIRGLIEFTNYCKNNCLYCGIRRDNQHVKRYRLDKNEILACCKQGYELGFRTFVLQGGEDNYFTDEMISEIITEIKSLYSDCAVTLSIGERTKETYKAWFDAGADRYLLRHETANEEHYKKIHPECLRLKNRKKCLWDLKEIGYQVGSGFMVGSPFQTIDCLIEDIRFLQELQPDMIGIGPFLSHKQTPFHSFPNGDFHKCLRLIAILRLIFPYSLIPATTALGTINTQGREMGLKAGANIVMPNLSPVKFRKQYELYDNKICTNEEAAECKSCLEKRVQSAGYRIVTDVGHVRR